ncbi:MAG: bile acid:sodium symporter family protein [Thauera sp.]|nr:bile acid:sodium symporter family protein [Thauera sp.]
MSIDVLLPAALAFIMFSVGLALRADDFHQVFQAPRALVIGLCGQLVVVPLAALAVVFLFELPPALGMGLMILAACPGGASSGFLTHVARGNAALSLTLTVISSLAALVTFPLLVKLVLAWLGEGVFGAGGSAEGGGGVIPLTELPVGRLIGSVLVVTTLPILAGMALRHKAPGLTARAEPMIGRVATLFFAAIVVATFVSHQHTILANLLSIGPATMALNFAVMGAAYGLVMLAGASGRDAVAVAMECGLQNAGLAIFVAIVLLGQPELAVAAVVYALTMNFGALGLVFIARRRVARTQLAQGWK